MNVGIVEIDFRDIDDQRGRLLAYLLNIGDSVKDGLFCTDWYRAMAEPEFIDAANRQ